MRQKSVPVKEPAAQVVKNIRRATRLVFGVSEHVMEKSLIRSMS